MNTINKEKDEEIKQEYDAEFSIGFRSQTQLLNQRWDKMAKLLESMRSSVGSSYIGEETKETLKHFRWVLEDIIEYCQDLHEEVEKLEDEDN